MTKRPQKSLSAVCKITKAKLSPIEGEGEVNQWLPVIIHRVMILSQTSLI